MDQLVLALDLSTSCTGYAVFNLEDGKLVTHGNIKPKVKGVTKMKAPRKPWEKMRSLADQICELIQNYKPVGIVVEEITGSKNRLTQKVLDGLHWIVCDRVAEIFPLENIRFYDVTGVKGWRKHLNLKLLEDDKKWNKEARDFNKKNPQATPIPIKGPKHLSTRHVNYTYGLDLDVDQRVTDGDEADAICVGEAFVRFQYTPGEFGAKV